jgi:hypothetical protein
MFRLIMKPLSICPVRSHSVCAGHKVLMEVSNNIMLDSQGILDQQPWPDPINILNIIIILISYIE